MLNVVSLAEDSSVILLREPLPVLTSATPKTLRAAFRPHILAIPEDLPFQIPLEMRPPHHRGGGAMYTHIMIFGLYEGEENDKLRAVVMCV